jgi:hypothetical protein
MDVVNKSCKITQDWVIDLNGGIELLTFYLSGQSHMVQSINSLTRIHSIFIWEVLIKLSKLSKFNALMLMIR